MFRLFSILIVVGLYPGCQELFAQAEEPYEVATWKNFAEAAISYTWDDNTSGQLTVAMPLYDKYGFKVTFFTAMLWDPNWMMLQKADRNGHEVAAHSMTHTSFNELSDEEERNEQVKARDMINRNLNNTNCVTFAYPYCHTGNTGITSEYFISARGCNGKIENSTPSDFMNVGSVVCGTEGSVKYAKDFNETVNKAVLQNGWVVFLLHGIDGDGGWSPVSSVELKLHLDYVHSSRDKLWVDTYGNVVRYIKERNAAEVKELSSSDSLLSFSVEHDIDTEIYNLPLTIKRPVPETWKNLSVIRNGEEIEFVMEEKEGQRFIVMNIIPNRGTVFLVRE